MTRPAVIIEGNPFRSRLHVLGPLLTSIVRNFDHIDVIVPQRCADSQWAAFLAELPHGVVVRPCGDASLLMTRAAKPGIRRLFALLRTAIQVSRGRVVVFSALDDYFVPALIMLPLLILVAWRAEGVVILKYRVEYLIRIRSLRDAALRLVTIMLLKLLRAKLVTFDERVAGLLSTAEAIPDPWTSSFHATDAGYARSVLGINKNGPVVGLIGRQDSRKGIGTVIDALNLEVSEFGGLPYHLLVLGEVDEQYAAAWKDIESRRNRVSWFNCFVPDSDLGLYYSACDLIALPYAKQFTATSGVLAHAAAAGRPVVASDHGLVGYRVRNYGIGVTIPADDPAALAAALSDVEVIVSKVTKEDLARFASSCSVEEFAESVCRAIR